MDRQIPLNVDIADFLDGVTLQLIRFEQTGTAQDKWVGDVIKQQFGAVHDVPVYSLSYRLVADGPGHGHWEPGVIGPPFAPTPEVRFAGLDGDGKVLVESDSAGGSHEMPTDTRIDGSVGHWPIVQGLRTVRLELLAGPAEVGKHTLVISLPNDD